MDTVFLCLQNEEVIQHQPFDGISSISLGLQPHMCASPPNPPPPLGLTREQKICRASLVSYHYDTVILAAVSPHPPSVRTMVGRAAFPSAQPRGLSVRRSTTPVFHTYSNRKQRQQKKTTVGRILYQEAPPSPSHSLFSANLFCLPFFFLLRRLFTKPYACFLYQACNVTALGIVGSLLHVAPHSWGGHDATW